MMQHFFKSNKILAIPSVYVNQIFHSLLDINTLSIILSDTLHIWDSVVGPLVHPENIIRFLMKIFEKIPIPKIPGNLFAWDCLFYKLNSFIILGALSGF